MLTSETWDRAIWMDSDKRERRSCFLLYPNEPSPFGTIVRSKWKDACMHDQKKSFLCDLVGSVSTIKRPTINLYPDNVLSSAAGGDRIRPLISLEVWPGKVPESVSQGRLTSCHS